MSVHVVVRLDAYLGRRDRSRSVAPRTGLVLVALAVGLTACSTPAGPDAVAPTASTPTASAPPPPPLSVVTTLPIATTPPTEAVAIPSPTPAPTSEAPPVTIATPATVPSPDPPITAALVASTPYVLPVADADAAGWGDTHSQYPASDIFVGCGAGIVSPVNGVVDESRRVNAYDPNVDNPATRGGRSVAIIGDDGVRYYMAHFETIADGVEPGVRVSAGQALGEMGQTGRASACHVHFAISPPCPGPEWSVRRGVIWPASYLDDWRRGGQRSPAAEVEQWLADHPDACAVAMADPFAADS